MQGATIHQVDVVHLQDGLRPKDVVKEVRRLASHFSVKDDRIKAFCHMIHTNHFCENFHLLLEHLPIPRNPLQLYEELPSQRDSWETFHGYLNYYFAMNVSVLSGRSLFTTLDGHFDIAPLDAKENDLKCILLERHSAMTLRATDNNQF